MAGNHITLLYIPDTFNVRKRSEYMGGSSFDLLMEEVQQLQHALEDLERTNRELRLQLADLRMGRGIVVDIAGQHFSLTHEASEVPIVSAETPTEQHGVATTHEATPPTRKTTVLPLPELTVEEQATHATSAIAESQETSTAVSSPDVTTVGEATFLEEIMYDEFANQMTTPLSVWNGPVKKPETPDEAEKAALRRELMGSFLLE
jgi:hypothetical protein